MKGISSLEAFQRDPWDSKKHVWLIRGGHARPGWLDGTVDSPCTSRATVYSSPFPHFAQGVWEGCSHQKIY